MADGEIALQPGYAFRPSDDGLITLFLRPNIANMPFDDRLINHADVYSADPAELVGDHRPAPGTQGSSSVWYFFCSPRYTSKRKSSGRRQRAIAGGGESLWKSEGGKKAVNGADGRRVGYLQKFSYGVYESSSGSARTFGSRQAGALQGVPLAARGLRGGEVRRSAMLRLEEEGGRRRGSPGGATQCTAAARGRQRARRAAGDPAGVGPGCAAVGTDGRQLGSGSIRHGHDGTVYEVSVERRAFAVGSDDGGRRRRRRIHPDGERALHGRRDHRAAGCRRNPRRHSWHGPW